MALVFSRMEKGKKYHIRTSDIAYEALCGAHPGRGPRSKWLRTFNQTTRPRYTVCVVCNARAFPVPGRSLKEALRAS